jgi:hypothetical protein
VRLAIDDFGTGYSSLAYLQRLPAQVVKIDQSFVREMANGEREQTLVRSMISLSHDLGYRVVAEGIETAEAADMLADMECDEGQGYMFARPMEVTEFERWVVGQKPAQSAAARPHRRPLAARLVERQARSAHATGGVPERPDRAATSAFFCGFLVANLLPPRRPMPMPRPSSR